MKQLYFLLLLFFTTATSTEAQVVWDGEDVSFTKENSADWTLEENQDRLTDNVWLTRQDRRPLYNYKWWQDNLNMDATNDQLQGDFWNVLDDAVGGTRGVRWALLDDTGSTSNWDGYNYGVLGDSTYFYSFNNIIQIVEILEDEIGDFSTIEATSDFSVELNSISYSSPDIGRYIEGKKFGLWLQEEDIYLTVIFDSWGSGNEGGGFSYTRSTNPSLSLDDFDSEEKISLTPNPSSQFIQVSGLTSTSEYAIYNIIGKEINSGQVANNEKINIEHLDNGIYILRTEKNKTVKFQKI